MSLCIVSACTRGTPNLEHEKLELIRLQHREQKAHLEYNPDLLVGMIADDFTSIDAGVVTHPTREDMRVRFAQYFSRVRFIAWEDATPPIITIAGDASLATALVNKRVIVTPKDSVGIRPDTTLFTWLAQYGKQGGEWKLCMIISTRKNAR